MTAAANLPMGVVVSLFEEEDASRVGRKAAHLARAAAAGFAVPRGLVVTAGARALGREIFREIDERIALFDGPFAVRSSAVAEDGPARSYAGQLESELEVSHHEVSAAIERCWRSAEALRALRYGGELGDVAVILQEMVPADCAGVAFSADPETGERNVVLVEAVRGLGDALVSGRTSPEAWRVGADSAERVRGTDHGVLTEERARRVADLARRLEELFGAPQDVEWAWSGDELFLLQARPITALPAPPIAIPTEIPPGSWARDDHHGVLSPLGWAWFQPYATAMGEGMKKAGAPLERVETARIGGHLYLRFVMGGDSDKLPPRWILWLASRLFPPLRRANRTLAEILDRETFMEAAERWKSEWRAEMRGRIDALFVAEPQKLSDEALLGRIDEALALTARGLALHAELGGPMLFGVGKLYLFVADELGWDAERVHTLVAGHSHATTELHRQLEAIVRRHRAELEPGLPRTWSALFDRCPRLAGDLAAWLEENHLRMLHYEPKHSMLGERPEYVMSILEGIVHGLDETHAAGAPAVDEALREADERLDPTKAAELRRLLDLARRGHALRDENGVETVSRPAGLLRHFVLELGRRLHPVVREREHAVFLYPDEHGPALRGEIADLAERIAKRRGEESWALRNRGPRRYGPAEAPMPPADVLPSGLSRFMRIMAWMEACEQTPEPTGGSVLPGVGIGSRVVTGRARVAHRPEELARIRHGEIVVCRITSPEWAVALGRVAAIVTDEGGSLSHPAIIAREFGVPAVVGAAEATDRIRTGDRIEVDPVAGTVTLLDTPRD